MKVGQFIELLKGLPPDTLLTVWHNNHVSYDYWEYEEETPIFVRINGTIIMVPRSMIGEFMQENKAKNVTVIDMQ